MTAVDLRITDFIYHPESWERFGLVVEVIRPDLSAAIPIARALADPLKVVSVFEIEGWLRGVGKEAKITIYNVYGHDEVTCVADTCYLAERSDLPRDGLYFRLTIPSVNLLSRNVLVARLITPERSFDLFSILVNVNSVDQITASRELRLISIVTAGRSGSTYLAKLLSCVPCVVSPSTEESELTYVNSTISQFFSIFALRKFDRKPGASGDPDPFFAVPFAGSHNPIREIYEPRSVRDLFEGVYKSGLRYYLPDGEGTVETPIIVEKCWLSPVLATSSAAIGIGYVVLVRDPISLANSIKVYNSKKRFDIGFDVCDNRALHEYVVKITAGLLWHAQNLPNSIVVKYESLLSNPTETLVQLLRRFRVSEGRIEGFVNRLAGAQLTAKRDHASDQHQLTEAAMIQLRSACADYIKYFYADSTFNQLATAPETGERSGNQLIRT